MNNRRRHTGKYLKLILAAILLPVLPVYLYLLYAVAALCTPADTDCTSGIACTRVFIHTNGFHTDIIVPADDSATGIRWMKYFREEGLDTVFKDCTHISFGWGDKDFYMESFNRDFPPAGTLFNAIFLPTPALMHVEFRSSAPVENKSTACLSVSAEQYRKLYEFIASSFESDAGSKNWMYFHSGYGPDDFFYRANGSYHLFNTCNDWTNDALRHAGMVHTRKAPFAEIIMFHVRMHACCPGLNQADNK